MIFHRLARLGVAALACVLVAAKPAPLPVDDAAATRIRGHVQFLASDELEGRETGSRGYNIAAAYVASQFASMGLKPAGIGGLYQQVHSAGDARAATVIRIIPRQSARRHGEINLRRA